MLTESIVKKDRRLNADRGIGMMGSEAGLRRILATVVASLTADLPKLDQALHSGDVVTANRLLHAFKGYMPIIASDALIAQVAAIEFQSKTASAKEVRPSLDQLVPELQGLLAEINLYLA